MARNPETAALSRDLDADPVTANRVDPAAVTAAAPGLPPLRQPRLCGAI
ncbi:hypothetical protein [Nocardia sp. NPDC052566]